MPAQAPRRAAPVAVLASALALLLAGCAGAGPASSAGGHHPSGSSSASASAHGSKTSAATADPDDDDDDLDDDDVNDADEDDDLDDKDLDDDDLDGLGLKRHHVDGIDDEDDLKDFVDAARRASKPQNQDLRCVPVQPSVDDVVEAGFRLAVDAVAAAQADSGRGFYLAVDLEDSRVAILYTEESPTEPSFSGVLLAVDDIARETSTFMDGDISLDALAADGGVSRAPQCL